ncbi:MAG: aminotransferase class I/II-fold pyridoxal phosphate-dependent enzyme [Proteobacteria bacterium]|nr:aminotransferase class I/II-fold pyridoxal phosphate-dependent enzyme [Pseudomonadota bacterium]
MKLNPFRLERYFAEWEFTAPYLLCCSDCESVSVDELFRLEPEARDRFASLRLGYTESLGDPELRAQIASLYRTASPERILVHTGAEEAIFNFMNVALDPGDHVVVHSPYYQSLGEVARSIGAEVTEWRGDPANRWELDLGFLKGALTDKTKVVVVNFPHNPTGFLPSSEFMAELSGLSDDKGFTVFSDEVYRGLEHDSACRLPPFADLNERGLSLGVMSKTYGLAGLRIGWIATRNEGLFRKMAAFKDYTTICNSAPSEFLATLALRHRRSIVARNLAIIRSNLDRLNSFFGAHADLFDWYPPMAGPIAFPRYLGESVEEFCRDLVRKASVLLLPGTLYEDGLEFFRIGFGRRNLSDGLGKLEEYIRDSN